MLFTSTGSPDSLFIGLFVNSCIRGNHPCIYVEKSPALKN
jgi:hypothetical protein